MSADFLTAVKAGDRAAVERMLDESAELAETEENGVPATMWAVYYGHPIVGGIVASRKNRLTLFEAAALGDLHEVEALLSQGADVNAYSADGFTALGFAAYFGHTQVLEALLREGANPNLASQNGLGVLPLHSALSGGHKEMARRLVEAGTDVNAASKEGWTPLHYCGDSGDVETARYLIEKGAKPQANGDGVTPSQMAMEKGHAELAQILE